MEVLRDGADDIGIYVEEGGGQTKVRMRNLITRLLTAQTVEAVLPQTLQTGRRVSFIKFSKHKDDDERNAPWVLRSLGR